MKPSKFTKENSMAPAASSRPSHKLTFGVAPSEPRCFGRENSPHFGGRASLVNDERG
jgi:hypothetical protein